MQAARQRDAEERRKANKSWYRMTQQERDQSDPATTNRETMTENSDPSMVKAALFSLTTRSRRVYRAAPVGKAQPGSTLPENVIYSNGGFRIMCKLSQEKMDEQSMMMFVRETPLSSKRHSCGPRMP
jgi:hypothetical protein